MPETGKAFVTSFATECMWMNPRHRDFRLVRKDASSSLPAAWSNLWPKQKRQWNKHTKVQIQNHKFTWRKQKLHTVFQSLTGRFVNSLLKRWGAVHRRLRVGCSSTPLVWPTASEPLWWQLSSLWLLPLPQEGPYDLKQESSHSKKWRRY